MLTNPKLETQIILTFTASRRYVTVTIAEQTVIQRNRYT